MAQLLRFMFNKTIAILSATGWCNGQRHGQQFKRFGVRILCCSFFKINIQIVLDTRSSNIWRGSKLSKLIFKLSWILIKIMFCLAQSLIFILNKTTTISSITRWCNGQRHGLQFRSCGVRILCCSFFKIIIQIVLVNTNVMFCAAQNLEN